MQELVQKVPCHTIEYSSATQANANVLGEANMVKYVLLSAFAMFALYSRHVASAGNSNVSNFLPQTRLSVKI